MSPFILNGGKKKENWKDVMIFDKLFHLFIYIFIMLEGSAFLPLREKSTLEAPKMILSLE